jgi:hypothetical protein
VRKYLCLCFERPVRMELRPFELAVGLSLWPNPEICRPLPVARVWQIRTPVTKKLKNSLAGFMSSAPRHTASSRAGHPPCQPATRCQITLCLEHRAQPLSAHATVESRCRYLYLSVAEVTATNRPLSLERGKISSHPLAESDGVAPATGETVRTASYAITLSMYLGRFSSPIGAFAMHDASNFRIVQMVLIHHEESK